MQLREAKPDSMKLYDCDYNHFNEWEENSIYLPFFAELKGSDYQSFSRGRVIYSDSGKVFRIFADKRIVKSSKSRSTIIDKFQLSNFTCIWLLDPHYRIFRQV